jgi:hypothetical protein
MTCTDNWQNRSVHLFRLRLSQQRLHCMKGDSITAHWEDVPFFR